MVAQQGWDYLMATISMWMSLSAHGLGSQVEKSQDREFYVDLSSGVTTFDFHTAAG